MLAQCMLSSREVRYLQAEHAVDSGGENPGTVVLICVHAWPMSSSWQVGELEQVPGTRRGQEPG